MNAVAAYGRLVWRPRAAFQLYLVLCMVAALCMWVGWLHGLVGEDEAAVMLRRLRLLLIVLPFCIGVAAASPVGELLHAQIAWHLPHLRRRMGLALGLVGLLCAAATVTGLELSGWLAVPIVPALALALLAFAMGLLALDWMHPRKAAVRGSLALTAALLLFSEGLWSATSRWPVLATLLGVGGAAWLLRQCVSRETLRHKGIVRVQRAMGLALTVSPSWDDVPVPEVRAPMLPPALAPRGDRPWMWVRAAYYENFGMGRRGAGWRVALLVLWLPLMLCAFAFVDGWLTTGSAGEGLEHLHHSLTVGRRPGDSPIGADFMLILGPLLLLFFAGVFVDEVLKPVHLQPISRRERAEIVWRLHLLHDLGLLAVIALALFVTSELLALLGGFEGRGGPLPAWLRPILVVMVLAPLLRCVQHMRSSRGSKASAPALGARNLAWWMLAGVAATGISIGWGRAAELLPGPAWGALVLGLLALLQLLLRARLRRWFARCDLA